MKDKLRELAERWRRRASLSNSKGDLAFANNKCAAELLAILDAEGDGGVVPVGYADPLSMQGYTLGQHGDFCVGDKSSVRSVPLYDRPHPARSGVVRDEDVEAACRVNYESDGNSKWDKLAECWKVKHRTAMRAALEHFAKGERHER